PTTKDLMPLRHQSDALDTENKDSVLSGVKGATAAGRRPAPAGPPRRPAAGSGRSACAGCPRPGPSP
ncbi:hypothetical protein ABZ760_36945, partial [Streptomyces sp. NPDC006658]